MPAVTSVFCTPAAPHPLHRLWRRDAPGSFCWLCAQHPSTGFGKHEGPIISLTINYHSSSSHPKNYLGEEKSIFWNGNNMLRVINMRLTLHSQQIWKTEFNSTIISSDMVHPKIKPWRRLLSLTYNGTKTLLRFSRNSFGQLNSNVSFHKLSKQPFSVYWMTPSNCITTQKEMYIYLWLRVPCLWPCRM